MKFTWFVVQYDGRHGINTKRDGSGKWFTRGDADTPFTYRSQNDAVKMAARLNKTFKQLGLYKGGFKLSYNGSPVITGDPDAITGKINEILSSDGDGAVNITIERE